MLLLATLLGGYGYLGGLLKLALLGCAIAAMNFEGGSGGKLGRALKAGHFGLAANLYLNFLLSGLEAQNLGFLVKTYELCLEGLGGTARENGACKRQRSDNSE